MAGINVLQIGLAAKQFFVSFFNTDDLESRGHGCDMPPLNNDVGFFCLL